MKNIPEINHCKPNPKAFWCSRCKAHNSYNYSYRSGGKNSYEVYACKACGFSMFRPAQTSPWMKGLTGGGLLLMVSFPLWGENWPFPLAMGAFFGLIGGMMIHYMRKWFGWSSAPKRKSPKELELEALNHPFQPEYEQDEHFTDWARQFLSEEEVDRLHEKYGSNQGG